MQIINLNAEQKAQVDTDVIVGIENFSPAGTFRYNMDKLLHIENILGDVSEYIVDLDTIVMSDPKLDI